MQRILIVLLTASLFITGCSKQAKLDENGWPRKLVFAFVPDEEEPGRQQEVYGMLSAYLEREIGIEVEIKKTSSYAPVIEALRAKKVDMANLSTFTYMIARKKAGVEPLVARTFLDGRPRDYYSIFVTRADTKWQDLDELVEDAKNVRFAFVNPASTSGHLLPRAALENKGLVPETDFKELVYPGSQSATVLSVLSGQVDAAAVSDANVRKIIRMGKLKEGELRVLGKSPPIPSGSLSIRSELPESLKQAIRTAYVELPERDSELDATLKEMSNRYAEYPVGDYVVVDDSRYDELRVLTDTIESLAMLR